MNEIPNDKEITHKPRFLQNAELMLKAPVQFRIPRSPLAVARSQAVITKLAQISFTRFSGRHWIFRIFRRPKLKIEMATFANLQCVRDRLGRITEYLPHLGRRFEIQFRQITHPAFVLHHLAGADAKHHVVRFVIAPAEKMHIVRRDQANAQISGNLHQRDVAHFLLFHSVIVQFKEEIFRAEDIPIFGGTLFCFLDVVCLNRAVDFARKTTAQSN